MYAAVHAGDVAEARRLLAEHPDLLKRDANGSWLHHASRHDNVAMVEMLVDAGLSVDTPRLKDPDTPLSDAARRGCIQVARWLLDHGADPDGGGPIIGAVISGDLPMIRLLLDYGADINSCYGSPQQNALTTANIYGKDEIARYLKDHGAVKPGTDLPPQQQSADLVAHVERAIGPVSNLAIAEVVAGIVSVTVHVIPAAGRDRITLFTTGMGSRPMKAPEGAQRYSELLIHLPPDWPLTKDALKDRNNYWPVEWLRRLANYPHEHDAWLGAEFVVSNGDPPAPFAPKTALCAILLLSSPYLDKFESHDGRVVTFYELIPLYKEERDFHRIKGTEQLLELFESHGVSEIVDMNRTNVAATIGK
jgi:hypothetical protein